MNFCVFGRSGLLHEFVQLLELTESFLHSNELVEFTQPLELTDSCCTRMNCLSSQSARWLTCYACAVDVSPDVFGTLCVRWDVTGWSHCQYLLKTAVAAQFGPLGAKFSRGDDGALFPVRSGRRRLLSPRDTWTARCCLELPFRGGRPG